MQQQQASTTKNHAKQDRCVRIIAGKLSKAVLTNLASALRNVFGQPVTLATIKPGPEASASVEIVSPLAVWIAIFKSPATITLDCLMASFKDHAWNQRQQAFEKAACQAGQVGESMAVLRDFYNALALAAPRGGEQLSLRITITSAAAPALKLDVSMHDEHGFIEQFSRFIVLAQTIHAAARQLRQQQHIEFDEIFCICKQRDGFELKWLDDDQDRYVNQHFNTQGQPTSEIDIVHNG